METKELQSICFYGTIIKNRIKKENKGESIVKRFFAALMILFLCVTLPLTARADFGNFSGNSDYGGGGGSSSHSSHSSGSSFDHDYSSGSSRGSNSSSPVVTATVITIVIIVLLVKARSGRGGGSGSGSSRGGVPPVPVKTAVPCKPMSQYKELDDQFDQAELKEKISNLYVQMQNCWQDRNLEPLQPYFTDALLNQMTRSVETMKKLGQTNYVQRIAVLGVDLEGWYQEEGEDHVLAIVRTRIVDFTLDDNSGKLISGDRTKEKFMTYEWDLCRATGATTKQVEGTETVNCPNCGAPVSINETAKCPYCGSVITVENQDWVISSIRGIAQQS